MAEIALTVFYFMLVIFTFMEGVRLIHDVTILDYLAREAVRYAVVRGRYAAADGTNNDAPATNVKVTQFLENKDLLSPISVAACWGPSETCQEAGLLIHDDVDPDKDIYNNSPGQPFRVTVSHDVFNIFSDALWLVPEGTYTRTAEAKILY